MLMTKVYIVIQRQQSWDCIQESFCSIPSCPFLTFRLQCHATPIKIPVPRSRVPMFLFSQPPPQPIFCLHPNFLAAKFRKHYIGSLYWVLFIPLVYVNLISFNLNTNLRFLSPCRNLSYNKIRYLPECLFCGTPKVTSLQVSQLTFLGEHDLTNMFWLFRNWMQLPYKKNHCLPQAVRCSEELLQSSKQQHQFS